MYEMYPHPTLDGREPVATNAPPATTSEDDLAASLATFDSDPTTATSHWCGRCGIHRCQTASELCPVCKDDVGPGPVRFDKVMAWLRTRT